MSQKYNVFYSSQDSIHTECFRFSLSSAESFTPEPQGVSIEIASIPTGNYAGQYVVVAKSGLPTWYGVVTHQVDATHLYVVPIQSSADTGNIFQAYASPTTVTSEKQPHVTLSIDLSDAPDGTYTYVIAGSCSIASSKSGSGGVVRPSFLRNCKPGDIFSNDEPRFLGRYHFNNGSYVASRETLEDTYLYNIAHSVTLAAGSVTEFHIAAEATSTSVGSCWLRQGRLAAFRVGAKQEVDGSLDTTGVSSSGGWVVGSTITLSSTDDYMILACAAGGHGSIAVGGCQMRLTIGGVTWQEVTFLPPATNSLISFGAWIWRPALASGTVLDLSVNNAGSDTATMDRMYLVAIPMSGQTGYGFDYSSSGFLSSHNFTDTNSTSTLIWNEGIASGTHTPVNRKYIEVINTNVRKAAGDNRAFARPVFRDGLSTGVADRGYVGPGIAQWKGFWFARTNPYLAGTTTNAIETRAAVDDGNNVKLTNTFFLFLPEYGELIPDELTPTTIIADVESGLQFKSWNLHTTSVYKRIIADIALVSRVLRNTAELTELATKPVDAAAWSSTATDSWYWDLGEMTIYVKVASSPANDDQTLIVVALDTYGRTSEILYDTDGTLIPYESRLQRIPGLQQDVQARGTQSQTSSTLGSVVISAADRKFDKRITSRIYEGLRVTVRRGYSSLSKSLDGFHVIAKGIMGMPRMDTSRLELKLYDTGVILNRALDDTTISVYRGAVQTVGQALPVIYGTLKRVPAFRVTHFGTPVNGITKNTYKIASHYLKSIDAMYLNGTTSTATTMTNTYPASAAFTGVLYDSGATDNGWNADVVYVDVTGHTSDNVYTGTLMQNPGDIAKHLLQNYPRVKSDQVGGFVTTDVITSGPTITAAVFNINVASSAAFSIGDVIKIREGANSNRCYVYAKPSGVSISVATLYYTDDAAVGTAYTTAADVDLVEKSGGMASTMLHTESFRLLDRKWRKKLSAGFLVRRSPPLIGAFLTDSESVSAALNKIASYTFSYWYVNRLGRVAMGVSDFDASNEIENPGFEDFPSVSTHPFRGLNNIDGRTAQGILTLTANKKFEGLFSLKLENKTGNFEANPNARHLAPVSMPRSGLYAVTALVALDTGNGQAVRLGISGPGDSRNVAVSAPVQAVSEEWRRVTTYIDTGRGNAGTGVIRAYVYNPAPIAPPTIQGVTLTHWLKADEPNSTFELPKDNAIMDNWYNKGSVGGSFVKGTGSAPRYVLDYCLGRPGIRFDSVVDTMLQYATGPTSQYTLFLVYSLSDTYSDARRVAFGGIGAGANDLYLGVKSGVPNYTLEVTDGTASTTTSDTITANVNILKVHTVRVSATGLQYWLNGVSAGTQTQTPVLDIVMQIGNSASGLNGVVCELMIYNKALSAANRRAVESYLKQKYGIDAASIYIDNVEVTPIAGVIDDINADSLPLEFRDEIYPEVRVTFDVNLQDTGRAIATFVSDTSAKGLTTAVSEGKNAILTSAQLDLGTPTLVDSASAGGVGAALVAYFGRLRYFIKIKTICPYDFIPDVGMKLLDIGMTRLPTTNDGYPLFSITMVDYNEENAVQLGLEVEAQVDPIMDRGNIVQDSLPLGAVFVTLDTLATPTYVTSLQFQEILELSDRFVMGDSATDMITERGDLFHTHTLSHSHNIASHLHTFTIDSVGTESVLWGDYDARNLFGLAASAARGLDSGSHTHSGSGSGYSTDLASGNSGLATTTLTSIPGTILPAFIRARFMRHNYDAGLSTTYLPTTIYCMFESGTLPTGWTRKAEFNGYYLRGATTETAIVASATSATFTPTDTGSTLSLSTLADIQKMNRGKRLTVTNTTSGTKKFNVVVEFVDEATSSVIVYPLHESGDTANVAVLTANTTVAADTEIAGTTFPTGGGAAPTHDHGDSVASHTHAAPHQHDMTANFLSDGPTPSVDIIDGPQNLLANTTHQHTVTEGQTPNTTGGSIGNATGGTFTDTQSQPDGYGLIFMQSPATNRLIPTGAIIFFDGAACPAGYTHFAAADDLLIYGTSGSTAAATVGGHTHTFTANSHTFSHNHGGAMTLSTDPMLDLSDAQTGSVVEDTTHANVSPFGHSHDVTATVATTAPTLDAKTLVATSAANVKIPLHKKLLLCKKD